MKYFRKSGRACEGNLTQNQIFDIRDELMKEDDVQVISEKLGRAQQKHFREKEKVLQKMLSKMKTDVEWRKPKSRLFLYFSLSLGIFLESRCVRCTFYKSVSWYEGEEKIFENFLENIFSEIFFSLENFWVFMKISTSSFLPN